MKKAFSMLILCFALLMTTASAQQTKKSEQARVWKKFQAAIVRNDKTAIAAII
jgi:uncharacterized membrane protein YvbJ